MELIRNALNAVVGPYSPVYQDIYDSTGNFIGMQVAPGMAGVDWPWVFSAILFIVFLYCFFRALGGVLRG